MRSDKDVLRRALERLGGVTPETLDASKERVRRNLKAGRRVAVQMPQVDAGAAEMASLRRPVYAAVAAVLVCGLMVAGVVRWKEIETAPKVVEVRPVAVPSSPTVSVPVPVERQKQVVAKAAVRPKEVPVARPAPPQPVRFTILPPGEGRVILDRACGGCHRAAAVGGSHYATRAEYAAVVARMVAMGAEVSDSEAEVLTDYLFENLRTDPAGRVILDRACTTCHGVNGLANYSYDSEGAYRELVETMVSYGAVLSDAEKATLIRYLFATYGKR